MMMPKIPMVMAMTAIGTTMRIANGGLSKKPNELRTFKGTT